MHPTRRLAACTLAALVLLALGGLGLLMRGNAVGWMSPLGLVSPWDLVATAIAMVAGGVVARRDFVVPAVLIVLVVGIAGAVGAYVAAPPRVSGVGRWLLHNTLLQLALSMLVAGVAARAGERLAARHAA
ncbi:hypothetical protein [Lysobacter xanthus]